jgi:hypothetical protein
LNTIKTTVKIAGFLLVVLLALGCGGSMQGPNPSVTLEGKFLYVANAGTEAAGVSAYRIDGLRCSLMPTAPEFATTEVAFSLVSEVQRYRSR